MPDPLPGRLENKPGHVRPLEGGQHGPDVIQQNIRDYKRYAAELESYSQELELLIQEMLPSDSTPESWRERALHRMGRKPIILNE